MIPEQHSKIQVGDISCEDVGVLTKYYLIYLNFMQTVQQRLSQTLLTNSHIRWS